MKKICLVLVIALFLILFIEIKIMAQGMDNPPPVDSLHCVASCVNYGGFWYSPQYYPHAKHITNVKVGSYYFPVLIWNEGYAWNYQMLFSYWDDRFKFWSYPDSFTTGNGENTGSGNIWADSKGNLYFAWHKSGNPDGYEIYYTRALLDTSAGMPQYYVERPAVMISGTNEENETYPAMAVYDDTVIVIVFTVGSSDEKHAIGYNISKDGGSSWLGPSIAYEHGGIIPGTLIYPSIAPDPTNGDMWVSLSFNDGGTSATDIVALHYDVDGDIWTKETAAISPFDPETEIYSMYSLPVVSVDYSGIPSIAFLVLIGGVWGQHPIWYRDGILLFTRRVGGTWIPPVEIGFPENGPTNAISGFPSIGITSANDIYILSTQPESANSDTYPIFPFNVYCWKIEPESGIFDVPRTRVSEITSGDSVLAVFPHTTYNIPTDSSEGPGITWCQMRNGYFGYVPPSDIYYKHMHQLAGIEEKRDQRHKTEDIRLSTQPNPFSTSTTISLLQSVQEHRSTSAQAKDLELKIYDVSGRLVRNLAAGDLCSGALLWRAEDDGGRRVKSGIYFVRLKAGEKVITKKLILLE